MDAHADIVNSGHANRRQARRRLTSSQFGVQEATPQTRGDPGGVGLDAVVGEIATYVVHVPLKQRVGVLLSTTSPVATTGIGETAIRVGGKMGPRLVLIASLTRPFNLGGLPAISGRCSFTSEGPPIGLQLAGRPFEDATLLRLPHAYEQATDWRKCRPVCV